MTKSLFVIAIVMFITSGCYAGPFNKIKPIVTILEGRCTYINNKVCKGSVKVGSGVLGVVLNAENSTDVDSIVSILEGVFTFPFNDNGVKRGKIKAFKGFSDFDNAVKSENVKFFAVATPLVTSIEGMCISIDSNACRGTTKVAQGGLGLVESVVAFLDSDNDAVKVCESVCDVVKSGAIIAEGVCTFTANTFCRGTAKMAQGGFDWIKGRICPILTTFDKDDYFDKDYLDFNGTCVLRY
jgi:hypothetical protein